MTRFVLELRELAEEDLPTVELWFGDEETRRWLGDERWPRRLLDLANDRDRFAYVACLDGTPVGLADVERYEDNRAAVAVVVRPDRRRGSVGTQVLEALPELPELRTVAEFFGGVERGNVASAALVVAAGFELVTPEPDADGFMYFVMHRRPLSLQSKV